ncbi:MAG: aspartyl protease [Richelia sp. RM2_1_2]|jgi:predicted aspartyl protease|nr:aspartyl protease [Richelia sp. SM2_1_7]NJM19147.1 aspartyl protease [Richelia sp. SM1_7_0]NJO29242.1 aspartyl protease [Richelia sp. SL_2_1]NJO65770.1 aspartyl protease [Richelia sp. RM2_1_2]
MIAGRFGDNGELFFSVEMVAANGEQFEVEAILDTGFTTGWLAINYQDLEALEWSIIIPKIEMQTAQGVDYFDLYEGKVIVDDKEFTIPVHVGEEIPDTLMGSLWLDIMQLVVNKPKGILTLEVVEVD